MIFGEVIATAEGVVLLREMGGIGIRQWVVGNNWLYYTTPEFLFRCLHAVALVF